jgi:hypothetical protein
MNMRVDKIQLRIAARYGRPQTLRDYQEFSRIILQRLREVNPVFQRLSMLLGTDYIPISEERFILEQKIAEACSAAEDLRDHVDSLPNGLPGPETLNRIGFSVTYFSHSHDGRYAHISVDEGGIELTIQGCSAGVEPQCEVTMTLPTDHYGDLHLPETIRRLLTSVLVADRFTVGTVRSLNFEKAVQDAGDLYSGQWLLYLPFPYLGECLPPDIRWEPFHNGILIETTPHPPNVNDPADLAAGKRVREVLDEFGFAWQSTYAIHGWPPDEEEWRYEEFITGAPSGRKYRVRCIDFDGYDAQRKVLLYAKLFRRLRRQPKQWGLRGWDGPVINEARRQVRAAQGEPIEWHIGLEEPADRVRTLLADYTDITENQLKVIYTPLDLAFRTEVTPKEFPT